MVDIRKWNISFAHIFFHSLFFTFDKTNLFSYRIWPKSCSGTDCPFHVYFYHLTFCRIDNLKISQFSVTPYSIPFVKPLQTAGKIFFHNEKYLKKNHNKKSIRKQFKKSKNPPHFYRQMLGYLVCPIFGRIPAGGGCTTWLCYWGSHQVVQSFEWWGCSQL